MYLYFFSPHSLCWGSHSEQVHRLQVRAGAQCGEGRGLKPVKKKKNSLTNYETHYGNYDIDCLGHAYTVYGKWGLEIWSEQTAKSIFNKRKTV